MEEERPGGTASTSASASASANAMELTSSNPHAIAPDASTIPDSSNSSISTITPEPELIKKKKEYKQVSLPSAEMMAGEDILNNCVVKTVIAAVMGGVAGVAFGVFTSSLENSGMDGHLDTTPKSTRVVLKEMWTNMKTKSVSYAKGFAYFGAVYSFNECVIEKARAKHDMMNPALAGCSTGAIMAYGAGPKAMCIGCASVAAFSVAIEHFLQS